MELFDILIYASVVFLLANTTVMLWLNRKNGSGFSIPSLFLKPLEGLKATTALSDSTAESGTGEPANV